jgi:hypothetical protein
MQLSLMLSNIAVWWRTVFQRMGNNWYDYRSKLILNFLHTMDYQSILIDNPKLTQEFGIFAGPFVIGFLVLLLTFPFLCCCCICTASCPPCKCCRQSEDKSYTKC